MFNRINTGKMSSKKEFGSDYHFNAAHFEWEADTLLDDRLKRYHLFFSGRSALYSILLTGIQQFGWKNVYLPEYYCHEVDDYLLTLPMAIRQYDDGPYYDAISPGKLSALDQAENVFVVVNYFGFRKQTDFGFKHAMVLEDHAHDPLSEWALNSKADYCFGSLRKTIPIPLGGIAWSPAGNELPAPPAETVTGQAAAYMKLAAMLLKKEYLAGENVLKTHFRKLYTDAEALFADASTHMALPEMVADMVRKFPLDHSRQLRRNNYLRLAQQIRQDVLWKPLLEDNICPQGLILYFNDKTARDAMKEHLVRNLVFPAVLWPRQTSPNAVAFYDHMLFVHCDGRYDQADIDHIASVINRI